MHAKGGVTKCVWGEYKGGGGSKKAEKLRTYYVHVPLTVLLGFLVMCEALIPPSFDATTFF